MSSFVYFDSPVSDQLAPSDYVTVACQRLAYVATRVINPADAAAEIDLAVLTILAPSANVELTKIAEAVLKVDPSAEVLDVLRRVIGRRVRLAIRQTVNVVALLDPARP